jgi:photosystem II stability/assembly factor-like uncharacterized protein
VLAQFPGAAAESQAPEMDRPTARATWKAQWYNESASPAVVAKGKQGGPWSAEFRRQMLEAANREKGKWGSMIPGVRQRGTLESTTTTSTATGGTTLLATAATGTAWASLGPTKADVAKNGGISLAKTDAGRVSAVVIHPSDVNTIYAGFSGGGVWKTTNGGSTWAPLTENLGTLSVGALVMDPANPNTLYLGLGDAFDGTGIGLVKTTDGGATWSAPVFLGDATVINAVQVAPGDPSIVLAATNTGVFRSTNAGASWARVTLPTGLAGNPYAWSIGWTGGSNFVVSVEANPTVTTGTTSGQVHRSTDNGATWIKATGPTAAAGVGRITLGVAASTRAAPATAVLYAMAAVPNATTASDLADLFKSTNGGATWTALGVTKKRYTKTNTESSTLAKLLGGQGWYNQMVLVDPVNANTAYFGGQLLVAKTTDGGSTYTQKSNWLAQFSLPYVHADFHAGAIQGTTMIVGSDGGLFKSTDGGTTWTDALNIGITSHLVYSVGSSPAFPNAVIGGFQDNGTRVRSSVTPTTFNQYIGGDGFGSAVHRTNGLMLGSLYYTRIYKSTTAAGDVFNAASTGISESNNSASAPFNTGIVAWDGDAGGNTVFTWVNLKVYKSTNFASSWAALGTTGLPTTSFVIRGVGVAPSDVNRIGVVASGGRVFLTSNGGTSWTAGGTLPNNGLSLSKISFDPVNPAIVYVASVAATATASHLWKSTDGGATFAAIDTAAGFPTGVPVNTIKVDPTSSNALYAGTHLGVYRSTDGGANWARFGTGMPLVNVEDLYLSPDATLVRAATFGRGFWQLN